MKSLRFIIPLGLIACFSYFVNDAGSGKTESSLSAPVPEYITDLFEVADWTAPDTSTLPHDASGELIRYGRDLVASTGKYFGPRGTISRNANGMNCQNCHLDAGTRLFANSFSAVYANYPKLRPRSGTVEDLQRRINDCMERSMNGDKLDSMSREMLAMKAYINWVGKDVKKDVVPNGASVVDVPFLDRPASPEKGRVAFETHCVSCHGSDGKGKLKEDGITFLYPPLWGNNSFNNAAGLYRLSRLAGFIKSNMPFEKSTVDNPVLTDEEAWDIAAYINSRPRPHKKFEHDWPDVSKKPFDHPFGPYADTFSEQQHKFGPFAQLAPKRKK